MRSPLVGVRVGVACLVVHSVARALLPHSPTHTHTVRQTTVGVGTWVALVRPDTPMTCHQGLMELSDDSIVLRDWDQKTVSNPKTTAMP